MPFTVENEPMLEIYIFEATQVLDQMEQMIIRIEQEGRFDQAAVHEIFRHMHTIKGSSAMMRFEGIAEVAHTMEDIFYDLRERKDQTLEASALSDLVLDCVDFMKVEVHKIKNGDAPDGNPEGLIVSLKAFLNQLRGQWESKAQTVPALEKETPDKGASKRGRPKKASEKQKDTTLYKAKLYFQDGCEMEHLRAFGVLNDLQESAEVLQYSPAELLERDEAAELIRLQGFEMILRTEETMEALKQRLEKTVFLDQLILGAAEDFKPEEKAVSETDLGAALDHGTIEVERACAFEDLEAPEPAAPCLREGAATEIKVPAVKEGSAREGGAAGPSMISVQVDKLDGLMNLVGELVIAEAMVTQNPEVLALDSDQFNKAARQLQKITADLQDMVMSIRMVPLSTTFVKMHRIVRDMSKKLGKQVVLHMEGEETEVDKNIIERISDPLMHLIRNAVDHGLETASERLAAGKSQEGHIRLEARNAGSDVLILLRDDGRGLDKAKILAKARAGGLIHKPEQDLTDREIFNMILLPGFSTKDQVTEFSGRGVGMDVVAKNLEAVGGSVQIESQLGQGTTMILKIPLTLAIIEGMNLRVGQSRFTLPITSIKESFKPSAKDCYKDPDQNEMVMVRGRSYPILRLHEHFRLQPENKELADGILIMIEDEDKELCLYADELLGQQQVVVKALPHYIKSMKKILGLAGCSLLGDGGISLILDVGGLAGLRIR